MQCSAAVGVRPGVGTGRQSGPSIASQAQRVVRLADRRTLPPIFGFCRFAEAGSQGLVYGDSQKGVARHVDAALEGAEPAGLPVEQPSRIERASNVGTACAPGLVFPLPARADHVIQWTAAIPAQTR